MLYETLFQPKVFLILLIIGFFTGFIFDLTALTNYFFNKNKISKQILLFLSAILSFVIFTESNLLINYGDIRFFPFLAFFGALFLQRLTFGKFLAKFMERCYNFIRNITKKVFNKINERKKQKDIKN